MFNQHSRTARKAWLPCLLLILLTAPSVFAATLTFDTVAPAPTADAISNWTGATFDADNIGGSGVNANGSPNNGTANDGATCVASNRPVQGQTFTTGSNAGGYTITAITVRAGGYTNNTATGTNGSSYGLTNTSSKSFRIRVGRISGTTFIPYTIEYAAGGGSGNPGTGQSASGPGTYLTFTFKAPIVLQPNTVYAFDLGGNGNYFEMLGLRDAASGGNPYATGTAYTSGANGSGSNTITTLTGERVFQINLTAYTPPAPGAFVHPGLLNNEADFERMRTKAALGIEPWASAYAAMDNDWTSRQAGTWVPHPAVTVTRDANGGNFATFANDIAVAYGSALRWKVSGDTAYAEQAILILNAHATTMTGIGGDPNFQLLHINGYQFACAAEIMRSYSGWATADFQAFQTMMTNVFAPSGKDFLTRHMGQGYSYMWANWDLCTMNSLYALGVLCDDTNLTTVATDYFYNGLGEGCIDRTVNFIHPGHFGQTQEAGRDQGHNSLEIALLAPLCEMAWHQGVDLYGYKNNRVLSGAEYVAKYNLFNDVPFSLYAQETGYPYPTISTQISAYQRGSSRPGWEIIYNHYVNRKGLAAPWSAAFAAQLRPTGYYGQDQPGFDTMSASLDPIATGANPSGLTAIVTAQQPVLSWWGSAYATNYNVKRTTTSGSNYTAIATGVTNNTFTDTNVVLGTTYYYAVTATTPSGETGISNEAAAILGTSLVAHLKFDESSGTSAADFTGNNWSGALMNGPTWTAGLSNNAVNLASASSQYVSLPGGVVSNLSDFTISTWVYLNSVTTFSRIFDFGTGTERYMFLTPQGGSGKVRFAITGCGGLGEQQINGTAALPSGQWVHVAVTINGPVATLYVNGVAVGQNLNMTMTPSRLPATTNNWIGRSQFGGDPYLNGKVDDFRIYRGPLTAAAAYTLATGLTPPAIPAAPASLIATALPGNQIALSWPASAGATSYTVRRATVSGGPYTTITSLVTSTNYTDTGLTAGTNYFYVVSAANAGGDGTNSPQASAIALPPIPDVPTALIAFASSSSAITLDWADAANAATYNVKRSLTNGGPYIIIATNVLTSTFTDTGRSAGTTYYYVVSSVNVAGESANSAQDSAAPSDLLLHLRLDEITGTAAADSSGNGFPATTVNAPTWTAGKINNALTFASASSQYATLPSGVVSTLNDFTVCAWVKVNSFATWPRIFDFGTSTANYMFLTTQYTGTTPNAAKPRFAIRTAAVSEQGINSSIALTAGTWTHIAVAQTSNTVTLYINGAVAGTNTGVTLRASSLGTTTLNYLGKSQWNDPYLDGSIDDFRIYSRALSQSEITTFQTALAAPQNLALSPTVGPIALTWSAVATATSYTLKRANSSGGPYTNVASALGSTAYTDNTTTAGGIYYYVVTATKGLVESTNSNEVFAFASPVAPRVYLRFDEASGTTAADSSSNGWNGTLAGAATFAAGTNNNAVRLPGASADRVTLPTGVVNGLGDFTISAWVKVNSFGTFARVFDFGTGTTNYMFLTPQYTGTAPDNGKFRFAIRTPAVGEQQISSSVAITAGTWNHVAVTLSGVTATLYVNGAAAGTNTAMTLTPSSLGSTTQNYLGDSQFSADPSLNGLVDDFRIYNRAFTAGEIGILQTQLAAPTALAATPANSQVLLTWNSVANANSYTLSRTTTSGGSYTAIARVGITSFADTNVSNGTTYYYVVRAANIAGESADSEEVSAQPISLVPPQCTFTLNGGQLQLSWPADHLGWSLQTQTNSLGTNWFTMPGSAATNLWVMPIGAANNVSVFFRLVYP